MSDDERSGAGPGGEGIFVSLSPASGGAIQPLAAERDAEAAIILAACTFAGTPEAGQTLLDRARGDAESAVYGLTVHGELVAVYLTRKVPMSLEVTALAVAPERRRRGHGRACMNDALRRAGKRPLVVETDDDALAFYRRCGFKLVGRRTLANDVVRYRLGWHAPGLRFKGGSTGGLERQVRAGERTVGDTEPGEA